MPFEPQPFLSGPLLHLRPLRPTDFEALYAVAADPLVWEQHPASDRHETRIFTRFFEEALDSGGALLVQDARTGGVIGSSRFYDFDETRSEVEIGWTFLARAYWGGRYNRELKRLMLAHAFRFVSTVVFLVGPRNLRSQRALEKIGAERLSHVDERRGMVNLVYRMTRPMFLESALNTSQTPPSD